MKRPFLIYPIAFWSFIVCSIYANNIAHLIAAHIPQESDPKNFANVLGGGFIILAIWHAVRLVQLKSFNRWLSIALFALFTLSLGLLLFVAVPKSPKPLIAAFSLTTFAILNVLSIWYLTRKRFREFAVNYVSERQRETNLRAMQKASLKASGYGRKR
jgi:hypothetical protein